MIAMIEKFPPAMRRAFDACRTHFYAAAGFSALINLLYLAPTIYMMQVYDRVVPTGGVMTLVWITLVLGLALGTLSALDNVRSRIMALASLKLNDELAGNILGELVSRRKTELTGQAMREFDSLRQTMTGPAMMALFDAPWTPIYFIAAFLIHPYLGLMILCGGVILVTLAVLNERQSRERARTAMRANAQTYAAQEALASKAELIAALGLRKAMVARQQGARSAGLKAANDAQVAGMRYSSLIKFTRMFMQSLALGLGAVLAINGMISSGTIIAASVLLSRALQPIEQLVGGWAQIIAARRSIDILSEILKDADATTKDFHPLPEPVGKIALTGVARRGASEENPILRDIQLQVGPGEIIGVIGHSGAGKSTLARIIAGALAPDAGEVRIDGANYGDWDPDELARHIGYMPQESVLLPGTIAENISCFANLRGEDQDTVAAKVLDAAQQAGVHEMILRIPNGYAARVDDPGFGLSGGQVQRLALARAIYGAPKLLVLDEPNSALDGEGERALLWAVRNAKARGAAVVLVAHQAQIVSSADRLVMMRNGGIEYQGPTQNVIDALREEAARNNVKAMNREAATNV